MKQIQTEGMTEHMLNNLLFLLWGVYFTLHLMASSKSILFEYCNGKRIVVTTKCFCFLKMNSDNDHALKRIVKK